jgi:hypothetical protein
MLILAFSSSFPISYNPFSLLLMYWEYFTTTLTQTTHDVGTIKYSLLFTIFGFLIYSIHRMLL